MKTCKKCGGTKSEAEFYVKREMPDGLNQWCKACCKADHQERHEKTHGIHHMPASTARAMQLLREHNIPCQTGFQAGMPYKDLAVYGCIPVEAKAAHAQTARNGSEKYSFGFTKAQVDARRDGFVVLIAQGKRERVFVVPADDPLLDMSGQRLIVTLYAPRQGAGKDRTRALLRYENAFHLITEAMAGTLEGPKRAEKTLPDNIVIVEVNYTYQKQTGVLLKSNRGKAPHPAQMSLF